MGLAQHVALLKSAASTMDIKQSRLRRANIHEQSSDDTASTTAEDTSTDDMDDALAELEAYMSRQRIPGSSMNKETWQSLEKATHSAWDMISPDDKAKILNYAMERAERNRQAAAMHQRSANVTNMSSSDSTGDPEPDSAESPSAEDVRRMMGKQPTKKSPSSQRSGYNVRFDANAIHRGRPLGTNRDHSTPSDKWGEAEQVSSSESVPPFHFCSSDSVSSASSSSGPDEMATWGTTPAPSTAFDELDAWGATSDGDTVSTPHTTNAKVDAIQQIHDPCGIDALWNEDQQFC